MVIFVFTGCDSELVSTVKNSEYSTRVTIGDIFDDTAYCVSTEWSEIENKKYKALAKVVCELNQDYAISKNTKYLVFNFKYVNGYVEFFNTYWMNKDKKQIGGTLTKSQSQLTLDLLLNEVE